MFFIIILLIFVVIASLDCSYSPPSSSSNRGADWNDEKLDYVKPPSSSDWSISREDECFNCGEYYEDCDCDDCDDDCDD